MKSIKKNILGLSLLVSSSSAFAQFEEVNSALQSQQQSLVALLSTVLTILTIAAFIFMVTNFIFNYADQKKAIVTFVVVLLLKGLFTVIF